MATDIAAKHSSTYDIYLNAAETGKISYRQFKKHLENLHQDFARDLYSEYMSPLVNDLAAETTFVLAQESKGVQGSNFQAIEERYAALSAIANAMV